MFELSSRLPNEPAKLRDLDQLRESLNEELRLEGLTRFSGEVQLRLDMEDLDKRLSQVEVQLARLLEGV